MSKDRLAVGDRGRKPVTPRIAATAYDLVGARNLALGLPHPELRNRETDKQQSEGPAPVISLPSGSGPACAEFLADQGDRFLIQPLGCAGEDVILLNLNMIGVETLKVTGLIEEALLFFVLQAALRNPS